MLMYVQMVWSSRAAVNMVVHDLEARAQELARAECCPR